uniref:Uncharacterized protein n=1 Tax=Anguilla anguilla TaxID=7936 RepID=A0A0E9R9C8_ANGAN
MKTFLCKSDVNVSNNVMLLC